MVTIRTLREFALSFPETTEEPNFAKTSFRVKKRIFATYDSTNNRTCIKLSEIDQDVFTKADPTTIYPVDNKWKKQGWTNIELNKVIEDLFIDALTTEYCNVAPKNLQHKLNLMTINEKEQRPANSRLPQSGLTSLNQAQY